MGGVVVLFRPCATTAAYEALPEHDLALDMPKLRAELETDGWRIVADAGVLLVVQRDRDDVSVFQSGKLMIKTREDAEARRVWKSVQAHVEAASRGP